MNQSVPPEVNDLSDDDMVSRQRESPPSLITATGIDFEGLERTDPVPIQQWIDRGETRGTTRATQD